MIDEIDGMEGDEYSVIFPVWSKMACDMRKELGR